MTGRREGRPVTASFTDGRRDSCSDRLPSVVVKFSTRFTGQGDFPPWISWMVLCRI